MPHAIATPQAQDLIARVGARVRFVREEKGIPRRVLSERSGVSPRYLAQLEAGEGNISIGLLHRVALALDCGMETLISDDPPLANGAARVAMLFHAASPERQQEVMALLAPEPAAHLRANRICLIGLRGAGKSTLGAMAGKALDLPFIELNREISAASGMPVEEVMALYGIDGYRKLEAQAVSRIIGSQDRVILEVAGGIVAEPETYDLVQAHFHTIWIKAAPQDHMDRVRAQGDERPMAGNPEAMEQLKTLLSSREPLYAKAQAQLDTSGRSAAQAVNALLDLIAERGFLA